MENQMIIKNFMDYMGKRNQSIHGWLVIWVSAVAGFLLSLWNFLGSGSDKRVTWVYVAGAALLLLMATSAYVKKYTRFYGMEPVEDGVGFLGMPSQQCLNDVIRSLSFDATGYYLLLGKNLLPVQLLSEVIVVLAAIFGRVKVMEAACFAGVICAIPWAFLLWKWFWLRHAMTHVNDSGMKALEGLMRGIFTMGRILLVGMTFVYFAFSFIEIFGTSRLMNGIDERTAVRFSFNGGFWMIVIVVCAIGISLFFTDTDQELISSLWGKVKFWSIAAMLVSLVISLGIYCYVITNDYVRLTDDSITVRSAGKDKTYGMEDVVTYRIFCQNEAFQMELSFRDGKKETIFKSATEETDGWYEKYCGDCNYALHLAEKLSAQGVVGTMADRERLENVMKDYDPRIKEGFAKLVEVMGVK